MTTRERPILFSAPMVRAILAGTKTQTRRAVKPVGNDEGFVLLDYGHGWWPYRSDDGESTMKGDMEIPHACPYGWPGDRLWVRETFLDLGACYLYRADASAGDERALVAPGQPWRPAIHMPRAASRITLEVTGVRVERLQDISEADARAEGLVWRPHAEGYCLSDGSHFHAADPRMSYWGLWDTINGQGSAAANPWVWVVSFTRTEPQQWRS